MKIMEKAFYVLVMVLFIPISCKQHKTDDPLTGKWLVTEATGGFKELNLGTLYYFNNNNEIITEKMGFKNIGQYSVSGDTITSIYSKIRISAIYKINDKRMEYKILNSDQKFVMTKMRN
jgi:hypothetical protein